MYNHNALESLPSLCLKSYPLPLESSTMALSGIPTTPYARCNSLGPAISPMRGTLGDIMSDAATPEARGSWCHMACQSRKRMDANPFPSWLDISPHLQHVCICIPTMNYAIASRCHMARAQPTPNCARVWMTKPCVCCFSCLSNEKSLTQRSASEEIVTLGYSCLASKV